jgi:hypothetical protein
VFAASRLSSEANERYDGCGVAFKVTSQAAIAADPRKKFFSTIPAFGQDLEAGSIGTHAMPPCARRRFSGISAIRKYAFDEWKQSSCPSVPSNTV